MRSRAIVKDRAHKGLSDVRFGGYLDGLIVFALVNSVDLRSLGPHERAANALGISPARAQDFQRVAAEQVGLSNAATQAEKGKGVSR